MSKLTNGRRRYPNKNEESKNLAQKSLPTGRQESFLSNVGLLFKGVKLGITNFISNPLNVFLKEISNIDYFKESRSKEFKDLVVNNKLKVIDIKNNMNLLCKEKILQGNTFFYELEKEDSEKDFQSLAITYAFHGHSDKAIECFACNIKKLQKLLNIAQAINNLVECNELKEAVKATKYNLLICLELESCELILHNIAHEKHENQNLVTKMNNKNLKPLAECLNALLDEHILDISDLSTIPLHVLIEVNNVIPLENKEKKESIQRLLFNQCYSRLALHEHIHDLELDTAQNVLNGYSEIEFLTYIQEFESIENHLILSKHVTTPLSVQIFKKTDTSVGEEHITESKIFDIDPKCSVWKCNISLDNFFKRSVITNKDLLQKLNDVINLSNYKSVNVPQLLKKIPQQVCVSPMILFEELKNLPESYMLDSTYLIESLLTRIPEQERLSKHHKKELYDMVGNYLEKIARLMESGNNVLSHWLESIRPRHSINEEHKDHIKPPLDYLFLLLMEKVQDESLMSLLKKFPILLTCNKTEETLKARTQLKRSKITKKEYDYFMMVKEYFIRYPKEPIDKYVFIAIKEGHNSNNVKRFLKFDHTLKSTQYNGLNLTQCAAKYGSLSVLKILRNDFKEDFDWAYKNSPRLLTTFIKQYKNTVEMKEVLRYLIDPKECNCDILNVDREGNSPLLACVDYYTVCCEIINYRCNDIFKLPKQELHEFLSKCFKTNYSLSLLRQFFININSIDEGNKKKLSDLLFENYKHQLNISTKNIKHFKNDLHYLKKFFNQEYLHFEAIYKVLSEKIHESLLNFENIGETINFLNNNKKDQRLKDIFLDDKFLKTFLTSYIHKSGSIISKIFINLLNVLFEVVPYQKKNWQIINILNTTTLKMSEETSMDDVTYFIMLRSQLKVSLTIESPAEHLIQDLLNSSKHIRKKISFLDLLKQSGFSFELDKVDIMPIINTHIYKYGAFEFSDITQLVKITNGFLISNQNIKDILVKVPMVIAGLNPNELSLDEKTMEFLRYIKAQNAGNLHVVESKDITLSGECPSMKEFIVYFDALQQAGKLPETFRYLNGREEEDRDIMELKTQFIVLSGRINQKANNVAISRNEEERERYYNNLEDKLCKTLGILCESVGKDEDGVMFGQDPDALISVMRSLHEVSFYCASRWSAEATLQLNTVAEAYGKIDALSTEDKCHVQCLKLREQIFQSKIFPKVYEAIKEAHSNLRDVHVNNSIRNLLAERLGICSVLEQLPPPNIVRHLSRQRNMEEYEAMFYQYYTPATIIQQILNQKDSDEHFSNEHIQQSLEFSEKDETDTVKKYWYQYIDPDADIEEINEAWEKESTKNKKSIIVQFYSRQFGDQFHSIMLRVLYLKQLGVLR